MYQGEAMWAHMEKAAISKSGREPSPEPNRAGALLSQLQPPEWWESEFLLFNPLSPWYFVMMARADEDRTEMKAVSFFSWIPGTTTCRAPFNRHFRNANDFLCVCTVISSFQRQAWPTLQLMKGRPFICMFVKAYLKSQQAVTIEFKQKIHE